MDESDTEEIPSYSNKSDDEYLPEKQGKYSPRKHTPKRGPGRPPNKEPRLVPAQDTTRKPRKGQSKNYYVKKCRQANKDNKSLKEDLQRVVDGHNNARELVRGQMNPYFIDDATLQWECGLLSQMVAEFAANWAASGSLKHGLEDGIAQEILDLVSKDKNLRCITDNSQSQGILTRANASKRLVAEAILAHYIHAEIIRTPLFFLQDQSCKVKGTDQIITLQQALEQVAAEVRSSKSLYVRDTW